MFCKTQACSSIIFGPKARSCLLQALQDSSVMRVCTAENASSHHSFWRFPHSMALVLCSDFIGLTGGLFFRLCRFWRLAPRTHFLLCVTGGVAPYHEWLCTPVTRQDFWCMRYGRRFRTQRFFSDQIRERLLSGG